MGGRILYLDRPDLIQTDCGRIDRWTGNTKNLNTQGHHPETPAPDVADIHFVPGGSMVVSRRFYEAVGPMREDYFLYYEEVDWALRRGGLSLAYCPAGLVYHRAGTSIGSPSHDRIASPFSLYFKNRSRRMFLRRFYPASLVGGWSWTMAKALQYLMNGYPQGARALLSGFCGGPPPAEVRAALPAAVLDRLRQPEAARPVVPGPPAG